MVPASLVLVTPKADSFVVDQVPADDHLDVNGLLQTIPGIPNLDLLAVGPVIGMNQIIILPSVVEVHIDVGKCFQLRSC